MTCMSSSIGSQSFVVGDKPCLSNSSVMPTWCRCCWLCEPRPPDCLGTSHPVPCFRFADVNPTYFSHTFPSGMMSLPWLPQFAQAVDRVGFATIQVRFLGSQSMLVLCAIDGMYFFTFLRFAMPRTGRSRTEHRRAVAASFLCQNFFQSWYERFVS